VAHKKIGIQYGESFNEKLIDIAEGPIVFVSVNGTAVEVEE
jgi:hypothetical protein